MASEKPMSKTELIATLAEKTELTKKQIATVLAAIAETAYQEASKGFTLPGIGKLAMVNRKARMGRNPSTGEAIQIPEKTVLKFRIAKAAKEAVLAK